MNFSFSENIKRLQMFFSCKKKKNYNINENDFFFHNKNMDIEYSVMGFWCMGSFSEN